MSRTLREAQTELERIQERYGYEGGIYSEKRFQNTFAKAVERTNLKMPANVTPVWGEAPAEPRMPTLDEIKKFFGMVSLDDFTTDHLTREEADYFNSVLQTVINWYERVEGGEDRLSFIFCSEGNGAGKTEVAKAMMWKFNKIFLTFNDCALIEYSHDLTKLVGIEKYAKMLTGQEVMNLLGKTDWEEELRSGVKRLKLLVIDEVGREEVHFEKRDPELQERTKRHRYNAIINWCYQKRVSLFITSNLTLKGLEQFFGDNATWSRLEEMCPLGCQLEIEGDFPDYRKVVKSGRAGGTS